MVLYRVFPFKYYIHESLHSHSCMNSCYSFMSCYCCMVAVIVGYDRNLPYNPYMVLSLCYTNDYTLL